MRVFPASIFRRATVRRAWRLLAGCAAFVVQADVDVTRFERLVAEGRPEEAMVLIQRELERLPTHPRLWYDYGVAAYAAGRFQEALLAFDRVEASRRPALIEKARRQKGNAEFHLGWNAQEANLDETIHRWQSALDHYRAVLLRSPEDKLARTNYDIVRNLLVKLLIDQARQQTTRAHQPNQTPDQQIDALRAALDMFREARQTDERNEDARQGERQTRTELAHTLASLGTQNAAPEPSLPQPQQIDRMQRGVNQLDDALLLLPEDKPIEQQLDRARTNLADLLATQARQEVIEAKTTNAEPAKITRLDRAIRRATAALDQQPQHEAARQIRDEAREDLALIREKRGDEHTRRAEGAPLEQHAQHLDNALREYQEALELLPQDAAVRAKADKTEKRLENALEQLAATLVPDPSKQAGKSLESLEQKAARIEGAQHALHDLVQLKPDPKTARELARIEKQLASVRELLADREAVQAPEPTGPIPPLPETLDLPPTPRKPPPASARFKSDLLTRNARDY